MHLRGGHWGLSDTEKPAKIFTKTEKQEEKSLKTEKTPRIMINTANS